MGAEVSMLAAQDRQGAHIAREEPFERGKQNFFFLADVLDHHLLKKTHDPCKGFATRVGPPQIALPGVVQGLEFGQDSFALPVVPQQMLDASVGHGSLDFPLPYLAWTLAWAMSPSTRCFSVNCGLVASNFSQAAMAPAGSFSPSMRTMPRLRSVGA